jgi:hypothetical protein
MNILLGGVPAILLLLDLHSGYCDLHRVAVVVLLRMLQECDYVNKEIAANQGIRILLESLKKGGHLSFLYLYLRNIFKRFLY